MKIITLLGLTSQFFTYSGGLLHNAGGAVVYLVLVVVFASLIIFIIKRSPKAQQKRAYEIQRVKELSPVEFESFANEQLCKMFSINSSKVEVGLKKDLQIPAPEIENVMSDFGSRYNLPLSEADYAYVQSVADIVQLLRHRIYDSEVAEQVAASDH